MCPSLSMTRCDVIRKSNPTGYEEKCWEAAWDVLYDDLDLVNLDLIDDTPEPALKPSAVPGATSKPAKAPAAPSKAPAVPAPAPAKAPAAPVNAPVKAPTDPAPATGCVDT